MVTAGMPIPIASQAFDLWITNREPTRNASLSFTLLAHLDRPMPPVGDTEWGFLPPMNDRAPLNIGPTNTSPTTVTFDMTLPAGLNLSQTQIGQIIQVLDHNSDRYVNLDLSAGVRFDRSTWQAL
jgi:hypothetical protein